MYRGDDTDRDAIALEKLTGGVVKQFEVNEQVDEKDNIWTIMLDALAKKQPMTCTLVVSLHCQIDKSIISQCFILILHDNLKFQSRCKSSQAIFLRVYDILQ